MIDGSPELRGYLIDVTRRQVHRSCARKVRHATRLAAEDALFNFKQRARNPESLAIYPCEFCDGFHIGNETTP